VIEAPPRGQPCQITVQVLEVGPGWWGYRWRSERDRRDQVDRGIREPPREAVRWWSDRRRACHCGGKVVLENWVES
jgi:hypothetical protein